MKFVLNFYPRFCCSVTDVKQEKHKGPFQLTDEDVSLIKNYDGERKI